MDKELKKCTKCLLLKAFSSFYKVKKSKDGYTSYCSSCLSAYKRERYYQNLDRERERAKKWHHDNRARSNARTVQRRNTKRNQTPSWLSPIDVLHMQCLYQLSAMRTKESGFVWHVDHIVPLKGKTVSGLHVPWNLRVIPATENLSKGNKLYGS